MLVVTAATYGDVFRNFHDSHMILLGRFTAFTCALNNLAWLRSDAATLGWSGPKACSMLAKERWYSSPASTYSPFTKHRDRKQLKRESVDGMAWGGGQLMRYIVSSFVQNLIKHIV